MGFSISRWQPFASNGSAISACLSVGTTTETASHTSPSSSSVANRRQLNFAQISFAARIVRLENTGELGPGQRRIDARVMLAERSDPDNSALYFGLAMKLESSGGWPHRHMKNQDAFYHGLHR